MKKPTGKSNAHQAVTAERAARLHRLLTILGKAPMTRPALLKKLKLDIRAFYRDLELLRSAGIDVPLEDGHYALEEAVGDVLLRLPFPDPHLTLGDALQLAKGRGKAHANLRKQIDRIVRVK